MTAIMTVTSHSSSSQRQEDRVPLRYGCPYEYNEYYILVEWLHEQCNRGVGSWNISTLSMTIGLTTTARGFSLLIFSTSWGGRPVDSLRLTEQNK